jgi:hypothetical protein
VKFTASTLIADAWKLWRSDRDVLTRIASVFMLLPVLAIALLLKPQLAGTLNALAPDDSAGQLTALGTWMTANLPWLLSVQIAASFGTLTILILYLDRSRPDLRIALRSALGWLTLYFIAMMIVSLLATLGIAALVIGYFFVVARLSLVGPVMIAERQSNPTAAIARSVALTRGHGLALTAVVMIVLLGGYIAQSPLDMIDSWMMVHAPNPIARAMVSIAASAVSALTAIATALVQVSAWRRLSSS